MKLSTLLLAGACMLAACSSSTDPGSTPNPNTVVKNDSLTVLTGPDGPVAKRSYDTARGGVQITAIYFDQNADSILRHVKDEWVVLESAGDQSIEGWKLNAGDKGQDYIFAGSIHRKIILYTHTGEGAMGDTTRAWNLSSNTWVWNNTKADTARLYDAQDSLVASATYQAK